MSTPVNVVDVAVLAVILLSALLAFYRGFVTETLSVASWAGASLITLFFYPLALVHVQPYLQPEMLAEAATVGGMFVISLVILTLISQQIGTLVRGSALGAIDRSLGFLFGMARGALLVVVAYLMGSSLVPAASQPDWLRAARSVPMAEAAGNFLLDLVPAHLKVTPPPPRGQADRNEAAARDPGEALRLLETTRPQVVKGGAGTDPGISASDRTDLERVLRAVGQ